MKNVLKKIGKTLKIILLALVGILLLFLLGTTIWNKVVCMQEDKALRSVGTNVKVNGTNIRVSVTGEGKKTIVLLSGMGTASPIIDFKPLVDKLSDKYKVVVLEYAGYGLSDDSSKERTSANVVEEIRGTLRELKIEPPYILMPHSISGIYCLKYMRDFPKEVECMIGIDCSVPNQAKYDEGMEISTGLYYLARFMDFTGLTRLSYLAGDAYLQDMEASGGYTKEEMKNVAALYNRTSITKARLSEFRLFKENCMALYDVKCPIDIPVLFILSDDSCKGYKEQLAKKGYNVTWDGLHNEIISNPGIQKITYLKGKHYLQWSQSQAIADMTDNFLSNSRKTFGN
jgi:Lysophospholipase